MGTWWRRAGEEHWLVGASLSRGDLGFCFVRSNIWVLNFVFVCFLHRIKKQETASRRKPDALSVPGVCLAGGPTSKRRGRIALLWVHSQQPPTGNTAWGYTSAWTCLHRPHKCPSFLCLKGRRCTFFQQSFSPLSILTPFVILWSAATTEMKTEAVTRDKDFFSFF